LRINKQVRVSVAYPQQRRVSEMMGDKRPYTYYSNSG